MRSSPYRQLSPRRWQRHGPSPRRLLRYRYGYRRRSPLQCPHHSARRCRHRTARLLFVWLATRRASACLGLCLVRTPLTSRARASRLREFWQSLRLREADAEARRRQCLHNLRICYVLPLRCRWALHLSRPPSVRLSLAPLTLRLSACAFRLTLNQVIERSPFPPDRASPHAAVAPSRLQAWRSLDLYLRAGRIAVVVGAGNDSLPIPSPSPSCLWRRGRGENFKELG